MTEEDLTNTSICVIINENTYAGTCWTVSNGISIAMIPVSHPQESYYTIEFPNIVRHEFGGHGFGRLADEYIVYDTTIPNEEKENLLLWQEYITIQISLLITRKSKYLGVGSSGSRSIHMLMFSKGGITTPKVLRVRKTSVVWMITDRTSTHKAGI